MESDALAAAQQLCGMLEKFADDVDINPILVTAFVAERAVHLGRLFGECSEMIEDSGCFAPRLLNAMNGAEQLCNRLSEAGSSTPPSGDSLRCAARVVRDELKEPALTGPIVLDLSDVQAVGDKPQQHPPHGDSQETHKGRPGRPRDTDPDEDKRVWDAWNTGVHKAKRDLATALGESWTEKRVRHCIDRHRQRLNRAGNDALDK